MSKESATPKTNGKQNVYANQNGKTDENGDPYAHPDADAEENENDHQVDNPHPGVANQVDSALILEDLENPGYRPTTRSRTRLANYCGSFSFVSLAEPTKYEEAMNDLDWMNSMQEELVQFKLNDVWELVDNLNPERERLGLYLLLGQK